MVRILALAILMGPAAGLAQAPQDISLGQSLSGALGPGDRTQDGRPYDDYLYSADPDTQAQVVVRSGSMTADVNVYFYDEYYDLLPLEMGGASPEATVVFTVPDAGSPTLIVLRVSTVAGDAGPSTGDYTIELSAVEGGS